jgi:hypothetical protein
LVDASDCYPIGALAKIRLAKKVLCVRHLHLIGSSNPSGLQSLLDT